MTTEQYDFLVEINFEFIKQVEAERNKSFISSLDMILRRYRLILIRSYAKILNDYFAPFLTADLNFMTEEEAQIVIDNFNILCNTDYMVEVAITDVVAPGPSSAWDDSESWVDSETWVD